MSLIILGVNHKTAEIKVREALAVSNEVVLQQLRLLRSFDFIYEVVILSTCNRTEWILHVDETHLPQIEAIIRQDFSISEETWSSSLYCHKELMAVEHLVRVACGLDSMVLGEPQILGQLKMAYSFAKDSGTISDQLEKLFQLTFSTAKKVRTETAIGKNATSVALIAVRLAQQIFSDIKSMSAVLVGAGDTIARVAKHLKANQVSRITVINRTLENAEQLAEKIGGQAAHIAELPQHLLHADMVITSTASNLPIVGKGMMENIIHSGKRRPIVMIDLAVPRDIEPKVAELDDIYLYCIDDLRKVADDNFKNRQMAVEHAEKIILDAVAAYQSWLKSLDALDMIRLYRSEMNQMLSLELERAQKLLKKNEQPDRILQHFGRRLSNKMMHKICFNMRKAGTEGKTDLLKSAKSLLEINYEREY